MKKEVYFGEISVGTIITLPREYKNFGLKEIKVVDLAGDTARVRRAVRSRPSVVRGLELRVTSA